MSFATDMVTLLNSDRHCEHSALFLSCSSAT